MSTNQKPQNQQHEEADKDLLLALYGKDNFLKIYQALEIGKIKFSFVVKAEPKNPIDCYMNVDDFVSDFIDLIKTDELRKLAYQSRKVAQEKGQKYPEKIWESRAGVSNKAAEGNKEQIRKFEIAPGVSQELTIKASQNGRSILVGFAYRELKLLAYRWSFLENDWNEVMSEKYSLANMKNEYHSKINKEQIAQQEKEEEELPVAIPTRGEGAANREIATYGVSSTKQENIPVKDELPTNTPKAEAPKEQPKEEVQEQPKANTPSSTAFTLKVKTPLMAMKNGGMAFQGWNEKNEIINVVIRKDRIDQQDPEIERVMTEASTASNKVSFNGISKDDRVYVA